MEGKKLFMLMYITTVYYIFPQSVKQQSIERCTTISYRMILGHTFVEFTADNSIDGNTTLQQML